MDNAAGSQVVKFCIDAISHYLTECNVQPAHGYPISKEATLRILTGYEAAARYINASTDEIVFGSSTTQLVRNLSTALNFQQGDNIVLSKLDHEAHLAAWVQLAKWKGMQVRWWTPTDNTRTNPKLEADDLKALDLINENTKLVCFTHTSNILGSITEVSTLAKVIKNINPKTLISVDAVAYAPHAPIDVKAFGVDFYFFSWYKVYGPHLSMAYVNKAVHHELDSLGHYFLPKDSAVNLLELAGGNYELIQSIPAVITYLDSIGWEWIKEQEMKLQSELLQFLRKRPEIQIYGEPRADRGLRVPVISFRVSGCSCSDLVRTIYAKSKCTPTANHFYAKRLCEEVLTIDAEDGVVRCSFLHYNTVGEVQVFIRVLEAILDELRA